MTTQQVTAQQVTAQQVTAQQVTTQQATAQQATAQQFDHAPVTRQPSTVGSDAAPGECDALLWYDFASFAARCFQELNPRANLAMN